MLRLKSVADKHPFYKYNGLWTRELQNLVGLQGSRLFPFLQMLMKIEQGVFN